MDTNTDNFELRKLESELAYYKVKVTRLEEENEKLLRANFFSQDKKDPVKKDEETMNLETDLEICENRIKELEKVNKELQEINIKYSRQLRENFIYQNAKNLEKTDKTTKELAESDDERIKAAYKDGYGTAVAKISTCLQEMKFDTVVTVKQNSALQKAFLEDYGRYYFKVFGNATTKNRLDIIKALKGIYNAPVAEVKSYVSSLSVNGFGCTILLESVSEATCKKLKEFLEKVQIECNYYYI